MPSHYTITEPHPTVPQNSYTHSGRGGLGNFFRAPATTSPSGVPTPFTTSTTTSSSSTTTTRRFYSGRGGAGNAHVAGDRPVLSFAEEEFARVETRDSKAAGGVVLTHVGRGGAGNIFNSATGTKVDEDDGDSLGRRDSASTQGSGRSSSSSLAGFWGRVRSAGGR
ncbi:hypothetical protein C8A01DRAFT_13722 [Parachaetomium inaequale]|uniref:Uncharacterized protein n=1 Tax=Parachaetomium inaequale TaxID=2588326 RepID=A0AAN6SUL1_9PEZI|nr:hypothetical protein C8A01DRAFT_13722 [Parachaetomium inaequale]